jgi:integrase/recombinase XerD
MRQFLSFLAPQLQAYLDLKTSLGFTSFKNDDRAYSLDRYLTSSSISSLKQLTEGRILDWIDTPPWRSAKTKNYWLLFAQGFFDYLIRHGYLADNPARRILPYRGPAAKPYIYTLQEIHQILEAARSCPVDSHSPLFNRTLETLIFLLYACGLRLGEALNLKLKDVDFFDRTLALWNTKFHKERLIPFSPAVAEKLKDYLALRVKYFRPLNTQASFFCHPKGQYSRGSIDQPFRQIMRDLGLAHPKKGPRLHDLRHYAESQIMPSLTMSPSVANEVCSA